MLDSSAIGTSFEQKYTYDYRDVLLYNLSVGAGYDNPEYVYEKDLKPVPTFGAVPLLLTFGAEPFNSQPITVSDTLKDVRTDGAVQMSHKLVIHKPLPLSGTLNVHKAISNLYDRGEGKGVVVVEEAVVTDENGELVSTNTATALNRWYGGFGGEPLPKKDDIIPEREPDIIIKGAFPANAPLLFRLNGDTFPLHADREYAKKLGFKGPIMHGLCAMGYVCRLLIDEYLKGEPERVYSIEAEFRASSYPGDAYEIKAYKMGDNEVMFTMKGESDKRMILDKGKMVWNQ